MTMLEQFLYSGGGFFAGVAVTVTYARARGNPLAWPWQKSTGQTNTDGAKPKVR